MKKDFDYGGFLCLNLPKLFMQLKIIFFLTLVSVTNVFAENSYSQIARITLDIKGKTLEKVFEEIEKQSEFHFVFDQALIDVSKIVSIKADNKLIDEILQELLEGTNIDYQVKDRIILLILNSETSPPDKGISKTSTAQQQMSVSGTVTDASTGEAMVGVSVMIKGTTIGALTDLNGKFTLNVPQRENVIVLSFVGYVPTEVNATAGQNLIIAMNTVVTEISEVVIVGYGVQRKESVVGAITQVDNTTILKSASTTVTNTLSGKLSGVLTIQQTGQPGNDQSEIIIRGLSSWNSSAPLVLVDGVERDFKDLDPNEINTISVLKDASATAVFGAKGANGVIIVTTKRGSVGKPSLSFSTSYGIEKATRIPDHISSYTTMSLMNVAKMNGQQFTTLVPDYVLQEYKNPSSALNSLRYPDVNWFEELTKPFAPTLDANINVRGGTDFVKYFCSIGYLYQGGFFKGYENGYHNTRYMYNRLNYRTNLDFSLTKTTLLSLNVGGDIGIRNQPSSTSWKAMYFTSGSRFPAYFPDWALDIIPDTDYPDDRGVRLAEAIGEHNGNPYNNLNNGAFNRYLGSKLFTDLVLDQKLDFILKGLSLKGKVALNTYYDHRILYTSFTFPQYQVYWEKIGTAENPWFRTGQGNEVWREAPLDINVGGIEGGYYTDVYYEMSLNYSRSFGKHNVSAMALMNRQQKDIGLEFPYYNAALVGRATYDFNRRYLLEINIGYTGSERFAPGNRYGFFPAGAIGWVVSEEQFFKDAIPWINKFKIRYSDGLVGSDYATSRWLYMSDFYKDGSGSIIEDKAPNPTSGWEEARKRDIGLELAFFNNALSVNIDFFDEYRNKMLLTPRSVTPLVGNVFKDLNLGSMKKHGFEVELEYRKQTARKLDYYFRGIFGFNENRIIFKDDLPYAPEYTKNAGKPLDAQLNGVLLTGTGYYTSVDDIHKNVSPVDLTTLYVGDYKYLDYTADGRITILDKYPIKGQTYPPITFSFSSGINYRGFDFHLMFQGNVGKFVEFNQGYEWEFLFEDWKLNASQLDYWTPTNPDANHSTLHFHGAAPVIHAWGGGGAQEGYAIMIEDRSWRNADYVRLKELYAGYTLNPRSVKLLSNISNLQIFISANNLWTLTNLIEGDPERKDFTAGFYPQMTTVKLGCKVAF